MIAAPTVAGAALGFVFFFCAVSLVSCGVAIEVPEMISVAVSLVLYDERISEPGAKISTHVPKFEKDERASVFVVAPTVIALDTRPGEELHALRLSLPAATA